MVDIQKIDISLFGETIPDIKYKTPKFNNTKPTIAYLHTG